MKNVDCQSQGHFQGTFLQRSSWVGAQLQSNLTAPKTRGMNYRMSQILPSFLLVVVTFYYFTVINKRWDSQQLLCLSSPCWEGFPVLRCSLSRCPTYSSTAYFLLSGSFSLIFSSTLISSRAASLYFSTFLMIFRATRAPPLQDGRKGFCWNLKNISEWTGLPGD